MRKLVYATCPYCNFINKWNLKIPKRRYIDYTGHYCDIDEGGCDKMFLVQLSLDVTAKSFAIEGHGED